MFMVSMIEDINSLFLVSKDLIEERRNIITIKDLRIKSIIWYHLPFYPKKLIDFLDLYLEH